MLQGLNMTSEWRTVQFFVSAKGVHEVSLETSRKTKVRCDCPDFKKLYPCSHANYVRKNIVKVGDERVYSISIPEDIDDDYATLALSDPDLFREFVINHGRVLSID